jgi:hypothetical protein
MGVSVGLGVRVGAGVRVGICAVVGMDVRVSVAAMAMVGLNRCPDPQPEIAILAAHKQMVNNFRFTNLIAIPDS